MTARRCRLGEEQARGVAEVVRSGVRFALGTDGIHGPGLAREARLAASAGLSNGAALKAVTVDAEALCGFDRPAGMIAPGARADLIAIDGDPLADLRALESVRFVMASGRRVC